MARTDQRYLDGFIDAENIVREKWREKAEDSAAVDEILAEVLTDLVLIREELQKK